MRFALQPQGENPSPVEAVTIRHAAMVGGDIVCRTAPDLKAVSRQAFGELSARRDECPVGSVEFCRAWMRAVGVLEPAPLDYPECLRHALGRTIASTTYAAAPVGAWLKPRATKAWLAHVKTGAPLLDAQAGDAVWAADYDPQIADSAEWRVYVLRGSAIGVGRYDDKPHDADFDRPIVDVWIRRFEASGEAPRAYALDVALRPDGKTVLIEVTDGWALGLYERAMPPVNFADFLHARWREICGGAA